MPDERIPRQSVNTLVKRKRIYLMCMELNENQRRQLVRCMCTYQLHVSFSLPELPSVQCIHQSVSLSLNPFVTSVPFLGPILFESWCSAHGFPPIPSKRINPDIQTKHGLLTYHFS